MKCKICETRKPRRYCPGVAGDICSICCGTEREVTVSCPLDCPYLMEARRHEKAVEMIPQEPAHPDVRVTEEFLHDHDRLLLFLGVELLEASLVTPAVVDSDVRATLDALIRTYRTLQTGLYYETLPTNLLAAGIYQNIQEAIAQLRREVSEKGSRPIRDVEILGMFVFLDRIAAHQNNGRPRGRAFIDYMREIFPVKSSAQGNTPFLVQV
jgi:hypothetical protein